MWKSQAYGKNVYSDGYVDMKTVHPCIQCAECCSKGGNVFDKQRSAQLISESHYANQYSDAMVQEITLGKETLL